MAPFSDEVRVVFESLFLVYPDLRRNEEKLRGVFSFGRGGLLTPPVGFGQAYVPVTDGLGSLKGCLELFMPLAAGTHGLLRLACFLCPQEAAGIMFDSALRAGLDQIPVQTLFVGLEKADWTMVHGSLMTQVRQFRDRVGEKA
ncbi:MAG: hypothetical protein LBP22_09495 [Deltaproteobacteria bacterium]|jgi:hypothetical protein|nr:hypothetical protein [Deltaproteobacteria bacterium]